MTTQNYTEIFNQMKRQMIANQNQITDFNDGSVITTCFEAIARVVEKIYIETRIGYTNNLKKIPYSIFEFKKKSGSYASVKVCFTIAEKLQTSTTIPVGTKVSYGSLVFVTSEIAIVESGNVESNEVVATAEEIGTDYNIKAGDIDTISSVVSSNVVSVTNKEDATGGIDSETDTEMYSRFKDYISGLQGTSYYGLRAAILNIDGIRSVEIEEHFPPVNTYNLTVYVDDSTGTLNEALLAEVKKVIDGDKSDLANYPGVRAPGINVRIAAAQPVVIDISLTAYYNDSSIIESEATYEIKEALKEYINSLTIGKSVLRSDVMMRLRQISYIDDISDIKINGLDKNLSILKNQVARFNSVDITFSHEVD